MTPVKSSSLKAIGYDQKSKRLTVKFRGGGTYHYENVEPDQHTKLMVADSIGSFFHKKILGKHKVRKA
ncbi:KTSC domain-containing protein [uncultured Bradyrhizobium sp.]|uniref:KTSC domain-containing protein n=1 Tax=uncultured Bradyrhizobium sp. TaxID=199684 RepID=UPI0035CA8384